MNPRHRVAMHYSETQMRLSVDGMDLFTGGIEDLLNRLNELVLLGGRHLVVTANVDHLVSLELNPAWRAAFKHASLVTADGKPLQVLARMMGCRDVERLTGADLLPAACGSAARLGWRVAIVGGNPSSREKAIENLKRSNVQLQIRGFDVPYVSDMSDPAAGECVGALRQFDPNITFVCLGNPKQEFWILEWKEKLPEGVYVGAGAAVDFVSGVSRRAPQLLQNWGFEWLWRLASEPRRLAHRYLIKGPRFVGIILRSRLAKT